MALVLAIFLALASIFNPASGTLTASCVSDGDTTGGPSGAKCPPPLTQTNTVTTFDTTGGPSGLGVGQGGG